MYNTFTSFREDKHGGAIPTWGAWRGRSREVKRIHACIENAFTVPRYLVVFPTPRMLAAREYMMTRKRIFDLFQLIDTLLATHGTCR